MLVASLLAACDESPSNDGGPSDAPATSLPRVDLSERPVNDEPVPPVRANAASFIECEFGIWQEGWTPDFGPIGDGPDPDGALEDVIAGETLGLPDEGFVAVGRDEDRVLYTYAVGGSPKAAVVVADSTAVELDTDERWAVETFAVCDPAEFDPSSDARFPMDVWQDAAGKRVPTWMVRSFRGPEHCGWESATFLTVGGVSYISDPEGVLDNDGLVAQFKGDADLPADAIDTGYQRDGRRLWLSNDRSIAFIVTGEAVEAWPSARERFLCA